MPANSTAAAAAAIVHKNKNNTNNNNNNNVDANDEPARGSATAVVLLIRARSEAAKEELGHALFHLVRLQRSIAKSAKKLHALQKDGAHHWLENSTAGLTPIKLRIQAGAQGGHQWSLCQHRHSTGPWPVLARGLQRSSGGPPLLLPAGGAAGPVCGRQCGGPAPSPSSSSTQTEADVAAVAESF
jgi:hypothetical protein